MSTRCDELKVQKSVYTSNQITPLLFDLICMLSDIKRTETVDSIFLNEANEKLEIYVFYQEENFDIEDKIMKIFTNWEEEYKYFPELFIYPLDMISDKKYSLPQSAMEF